MGKKKLRVFILYPPIRIHDIYFFFYIVRASYEGEEIKRRVKTKYAYKRFLLPKVSAEASGIRIKIRLREASSSIPVASISLGASRVSLRRKIRIKPAYAKISPYKLRLEKRSLKLEGLVRDLSLLGLVEAKGYAYLYDCVGVVNIALKGEDAAEIIVSSDKNLIGVAIADGITGSNAGIFSHGMLKALQAYIYVKNEVPTLKKLEKIVRLGVEEMYKRSHLDRTFIIDPSRLPEVLKRSDYKGAESTLTLVVYDRKKKLLYYIVIGDSPLSIASTKGDYVGTVLRIDEGSFQFGGKVLSVIGYESMFDPAMTYVGMLKLDSGIAIAASDGAIAVEEREKYNITEPVSQNPIRSYLDKKVSEAIEGMLPTIMSIVKNLNDDASFGILNISKISDGCLEKIISDLRKNSVFRYLTSLIREKL